MQIENRDWKVIREIKQQEKREEEERAAQKRRAEMRKEDFNKKKTEQTVQTKITET